MKTCIVCGVVVGNRFKYCKGCGKDARNNVLRIAGKKYRTKKSSERFKIIDLLRERLGLPPNTHHSRKIPIFTSKD